MLPPGVAEIPSSPLLVGPGLGLNTVRQLMPFQCSTRVRRVVAVITHGPGIVSRYGRYPVECVVACARVRAGNYAPIAAIPVRYKCLIMAGVAIIVTTHGPHIVGRYGRYSAEAAVWGAGVGAGHNAP